MPTERFTREQFEAVLTGYDFVCNGLMAGEYTYTIKITDKISMSLRSSVDSTGYAAETGQDSIRLSLVFDGKGLAKMDAWTTRVKGWQDRLEEKLASLYDRGINLPDCPKCGAVLTQREGRNGKFWGCVNYPSCKHTQNVAKPKAQQASQTVAATPVIEPLVIESQKPVKQIRLNAQQRAYVESPIDANIRVMAGAGSGKTASTVERIVYLIEHGVKPENIVYCVYNKSMADEGFARIVARIPEVEHSLLRYQICTFHALFFRMLMAEGDKRTVMEDYDIKKVLQQIIEGDERNGIVGEWENDAEKPGYKEVLYWIDNAKYNALTTNEDYPFFEKRLGSLQAQKVHRARRRFDAEMSAQNGITFADMLFEIEQKLMRDSAFRCRWQERYTHILVDEGQDTNSQALRILITLSVNPGENPVYGARK